MYGQFARPAAVDHRTIDGVIAKLDGGDHPWAAPRGTHLRDVMDGATLIGLRLACKGSGLKYSDDVFQEAVYKELVATVDGNAEQLLLYI